MPTFLAQTWSIQKIKSNYASGSLLIICTFGSNPHIMHASKIMLSYRYPLFAKKIVHRLTQTFCSKLPGKPPKCNLPSLIKFVNLCVVLNLCVAYWKWFVLACVCAWLSLARLCAIAHILMIFFVLYLKKNIYLALGFSRTIFVLFFAK